MVIDFSSYQIYSPIQP